ncbi:MULTISPECIES: aconitate hydratase AcnA [Burkholderiaceae]|uniref:Aconitate hydratase n=1 Tax=Caballeronia sordidicola TaxID=196367 RepID=A0A242MXX7_CABSO|nr:MULTISPECIES: aconitate hydratase AcnA [Burkholderiaceae]AME27729.1 aconitate hydratase [Burkholderia sp. PAMC 26561]OTP76173.1 Aconitate hydratase [Caballeronia sordidicola]
MADQPADTFKTIRFLNTPDGKRHRYFSLAALAESGFDNVGRLPVVIRILLESVLRNCDGTKVLESHITDLASWKPDAQRVNEIPFVVGRVLLQDFTGIPLLTDLAAMRSQAKKRNADPKAVEPLVPVHLVVDHSVQTEFSNVPNAIRQNMEVEFARNRERYELMKWGMQAFDTFKVVPPGIGICHQINLEYLAQGVIEKDGVVFPDTLVGTDSHTTMINGIGVLGWGVGGIEAEAGMLGQPVYMLMPDVVGVELSGSLSAGVTATDAVLQVTETLRAAKVVGKLVEFFGEGAASLSATDRATIANMAPEYGATSGFFPVDENTLTYYRQTGRSDEQITLIREYFDAQGLFGAPKAGEVNYSAVVKISLGAIKPSVSGPKRPQDRVDLSALGQRFDEVMVQDSKIGGYGKTAAQLNERYPVSAKPAGAPGPVERYEVGHGDVLVAAITSCTNTSNPELLVAAGLVAKKALERGLKAKPWVKTLFTPGSRVVTAYLQDAGLTQPLEQLGFGIAAYGCGACVGNIGPLDPALEEVVVSKDLVCSAVLSGNRNFEARIHGNLRANFLASPPLVVAFALAGTTRIDVTSEALGIDGDGKPVMLADIWPTNEEIKALSVYAANPKHYKELYSDFTAGHDLWNNIASGDGAVYSWPESTYAAEPDFFSDADSSPKPIAGARALAILGNSITTDHISPAGSISKKSPAGEWLTARGVAQKDFNTYGARRGHFEVMVRGTFANVRLKNLMLPAKEDGAADEGPFTVHQPSGQRTTIFDASRRYLEAGTPSIVVAGEEYGTGSSRDWAAKGTRLLGVKAVIARSFERIHRSNLAGLGVLPLQFIGDDSAQSLGLDGTETFDIIGLESGVRPLQEVTLVIRRADGSQRNATLLARIDTQIEATYFSNGGILPYVLSSLLKKPATEVVETV